MNDELKKAEGIRMVDPDQENIDFQKEYLTILFHLRLLQTVNSEQKKLVNFLMKHCKLETDDIINLERTIRKYSEQIQKNLDKPKIN